ncbi:hypothetical protein D3C86_2196380 [compost metagenome]
MWRQAKESLTGARFDKSPDDQGVHQLVRLAAAHMLVQALGIQGGTDRAIGNTALFHQRRDLLEMA